VQGKLKEGPSVAKKDILSIKDHERAEVKRLVAEMNAHEELVKKVKKYVIWHKERGGLPTLHAISQKFKITIDDAENIAESEDDLELVVGVKMGTGFYEFKTQGEYQIDLIDFEGD
jgi:hypothetical protein